MSEEHLLTSDCLDIDAGHLLLCVYEDSIVIACKKCIHIHETAIYTDIKAKLCIR
jgi:hypothetical protein